MKNWLMEENPYFQIAIMQLREALGETGED
jgi:hypothetical protein